ncbi:class I SAM-dependent methyltransferase [Sneathiella marina]|uniref:Class I SAM-dependent methyltransferase n=1 Tax=Sneathiella marina TaxID=2950108 RepID=A0ABY4W502_9PROT|nr:class I SAM-dependent methyltransferase [Sneathiella marina]USG61921.1 class I SAM-dependent methyltransferase [Sneathiella marina]
MADYDHKTSRYQKWSKTDSVYSHLEWYVFLEILGNVTNKRILDVACGEGRLSRALMGMGAGSVLGTDISAEMIDRAQAQNLPSSKMHWENLTYQVRDASDETFSLASPVDLVTAMYLFHYAETEEKLASMCQFLSRNLKSGGRFLTYTINPDYNFENQYPGMENIFGFRYEIDDQSNYHLVIGDFKARMWQWSRTIHERCLEQAGFTNIIWHPLRLAPEDARLEKSVKWYLANPSCIVLSAEKSS